MNLLKTNLRLKLKSVLWLITFIAPPLPCSDKDQQRPMTAKRYQSKVVKIETEKKTYTESRTQRKVNTFIRYIENNRLSIFYLVLYMLVLAGVFIERAYCKIPFRSFLKCLLMTDSKYAGRLSWQNISNKHFVGISVYFFYHLLT